VLITSSRALRSPSQQKGKNWEGKKRKVNERKKTGSAALCITLCEPGEQLERRPKKKAPSLENRGKKKPFREAGEGSMSREKKMGDRPKVKKENKRFALTMRKTGKISRQKRKARGTEGPIVAGRIQGGKRTQKGSQIVRNK